MQSEIRLAGFTLTAEEWDWFDPDTRAELLPAADGAAGDEDVFEDDADVVW
jgi:hypothetical protein